MSLTRRQVIHGGLGLGAAAGLAACTALKGKKGSDLPVGGADSRAGDQKVALTFLNGSRDVEKKAFDRLIAAFTKENPNITVTTDTVPYRSLQARLDSRLQAGRPPDLVRVSYLDLGAYVSQGVLLDISGTFDQAKVDSFTPGLWQGVVFDGKPYGVPHQVDTTAILYRKDAFAAAGIRKVPTTLDQAWTWDEFAVNSRRLAKVVKGKQTAFSYDWQGAGAYRWLSWLFQAGGNLLGDDLKSPVVDSAEGRRAVEFTSSFFREGWVARNASVNSSTFPADAFIAGSVAMAFAGEFLLPLVDAGVKKKKFAYGAMPQPRDEVAATDLGGNALVAAKDGQHPEEAAKFLEFCVREQQMRSFCETTGELPTLKSLASADLGYAVRPDLMPIFAQQATTLTPEQVRQVTVPQFSKINTALANELEKAFLGGRPAAATAAALASAVQRASA